MSPTPWELPAARVDLFLAHHYKVKALREEALRTIAANYMRDRCLLHAQASVGPVLLLIDPERSGEPTCMSRTLCKGISQALWMKLLSSVMNAGEGDAEEEEDKRPRRPMNAVGLVTAEKVKNRAANAARTAFEAWQVRPREGPIGPGKPRLLCNGPSHALHGCSAS